MTLPVNDRISQVYITDGTTKRFDFTFRLFSQEDADGIMVRKKTLLGFDSVDKNLYSVVGNIGDEGGYVMFTAAPVAGQFLYIIGSTAVEQSLSITNYGNFNAHSLERVLDKIIAILQERQGDLTQEQQARLLADVYYDDLAKVREEDLKNYVDGIIGSITGQPFIGIADNFIQVQSPFTGSVERDQSSKNTDTINALDFGILPNINVDQSAKIQNAFNRVAATGSQKTLVFASGRYRLDSTVNIPIGLNITGESMPMFNGGDFHGTFFYISHGGVGFDAQGAVGVRHISKIATIRNQPDPTGLSFTPLDNDWDFRFRSCVDVYMQDCLLLNPTRGIIFTHDSLGGSNRFTLDRVMMQALKVGVQVDYSYDVCRFSNLHFWPFWSQAPIVRDWMLANTTAIYSKRNDNPIFSKIFSIWHRYGIRIGYSPTISGILPGGSTSKLKLSDSDFDVGTNCYMVDSNVTYHTAYWSNVSMQGLDPGSAGGSTAAMVEVTGNNINIVASNTSIALVHASAYKDTGVNNAISFNILDINYWNHGNVGAYCFDAQGYMYLSGHMNIKNGNITPMFSVLNGNYISEFWRQFVQPIDSTVSRINETVINSCRYQHLETRVNFEIDFTIVSNGTGAGAIQCVLPLSSPTNVAFAGREINTKIGIAALLLAGTNILQLTKVDGSYPGADGARIVVSGSYGQSS